MPVTTPPLSWLSVWFLSRIQTRARQAGQLHRATFLFARVGIIYSTSKEALVFLNLSVLQPEILAVPE
jgi:hypothetical protein